jgi:DNA ligase-1
MNIFSLNTLYNTTIGSQREKQWSICVLEKSANSYIIQTSHGIVGGKMILHETVITEGKNIGKKNETTPKQQAILEAEREWIKKNKQGYLQKNKFSEKENLDSIDVPRKVPTEILSVGTGSIGSLGIKPMLATEFDISTFATFPVYIQPKLDGIRCLVYMKNGKLVFQSRQNTIFETVHHLEPILKEIFSKIVNSENFVLDGELYIHGMPFNEITSMVRKSNHTDASKLQYHIYDCFLLDDLSIGFNKRNEILSKIKDNSSGSQIVFVETEIANSTNDIEQFHTHYTQQSYEGIMIRKINSPYKQQNRSKDLQKYKKFFDEEFEIIGVNEGTGSHSGTPIFICKSNINCEKTFKTTMQGTIESRKKMMQNDYIGKMVTVKYQEKSTDGIPRFPVGIEIRDYE